MQLIQKLGSQVYFQDLTIDEMLAMSPFALFVAVLALTSFPSTARTDNFGSVNMTSPATAHTPSAQPDVRHIEDFWTMADNYTAKQRPMNQDTSGITVYPAKHRANNIGFPLDPAANGSELLSRILPQDWDLELEDIRPQFKSLIQSSFPSHEVTESFSTDKNGFINAAIQAYSSHHHLVIRPDDIWLAILTQISAYINAHSEELRGSFVAHEGKKELRIEYSQGTRFTVDWGEFAEKIGLMIQDNVVDPDLREWIMPSFSTTTQHDTVVASVVMMASMQSYFDYTCSITCGLPSVTLLGTKEDYQVILTKLSKLQSYGEEPTHFTALLTPILKNFILSFDSPSSEEVLSFWSHIFSSTPQGSGAPIWSGWITAFMFWDKDGNSLYSRSWNEGLTLDGIEFHTVDSDFVPPGYSTVPVKIVDHGVEIQAEMLAGSVGMEMRSSGEEMEDGKVGLDTLQPRSGWWVYEK